MDGIWNVLQGVWEMLSFPFMFRAMIVGVLVSLCAALLGVSLVLKRYSMIGDGLSHVGFGALSIAMAMGLAPLVVSIPVVVLAAFLLLRINENSNIKGDAATAIISTGALAIGVLVVSLTPGMNADVVNYMFGSILSMTESDVILSIILSTIVLLMFICFYHRIFTITFDETFAAATGMRTRGYNLMIASLTAITIVLGMRMMGTLLISSLIIFPALTAMRIFKKFRSVVICAALISVVCFVTGLVISYVFATPTGASIVAVNIFLFAIFSVLRLMKNNK